MHETYWQRVRDYLEGGLTLLEESGSMCDQCLAGRLSMDLETAIAATAEDDEDDEEDEEGAASFCDGMLGSLGTIEPPEKFEWSRMFDQAP